MEDYKGRDMYYVDRYKQVESVNSNALIKNNSILIIGGLVGVALLGFLGYRLYKKYVKTSETRAIEKDLNSAYAPDTSKTTITAAQAGLLAQQLYTMMDGMGTDSSGIVKLICDPRYTNDDLKLIARSFGVKEYGTTGSPYWGSGTPKDLTGWILEEMSGSDLNTVKLRLNSAGILI